MSQSGKCEEFCWQVICSSFCCSAIAERSRCFAQRNLWNNHGWSHPVSHWFCAIQPSSVHFMANFNAILGSFRCWPSWIDTAIQAPTHYWILHGFLKWWLFENCGGWTTALILAREFASTFWGKGYYAGFRQLCLWCIFFKWADSALMRQMRKDTLFLQP